MYVCVVWSTQLPGLPYVKNGKGYFGNKAGQLKPGGASPSIQVSPSQASAPPDDWLVLWFRLCFLPPQHLKYSNTRLALRGNTPEHWHKKRNKISKTLKSVNQSCVSLKCVWSAFPNRRYMAEELRCLQTSPSIVCIQLIFSEDRANMGVHCIDFRL